MQHTYVLVFYFLSLHSLGTSNVFVSSSSQNTVILNIMYVSLLCVTLFDTVLYCLACQVLSCINFVVTVTVTDGQ
jgi:hypothetical protein